MQVVLIIYDLATPSFVGVLFLRNITHMLFNQSHHEYTTTNVSKGILFCLINIYFNMLSGIMKFAYSVVGSSKETSDNDKRQVTSINPITILRYDIK